MKAAAGRECPLLTPQKASHPSVWPTDTKAWGGGSAGRRGPQDQRAARRSRRRARPEAPQLRPHAGGGGPASPARTPPASPTQAAHARTRGDAGLGPATRILTGSDGVVRHCQDHSRPAGAQGVLTQVPSAPSALLPCRPRGRGMRRVTAALVLFPGPVPLAFMAWQESEGFPKVWPI